MDIGLECYISGHNGFYGQIKTFCQDFQVTEIDEYGEEVKLIDNIESILKANNTDDRRGSEMATENQKPPQGDDIAKKSTKNNTMYYQSEDIMNPVKIKEIENKLTSIVGKDVIDKLFRISSTLKNDTFDDQQILGCFDNKSVRALIHTSTRMVFPVIKTATVQMGGKYTITATLDPNFIEFSKLISERKDVENLMKFCHCVDKNTSDAFDLPTKKDKECRTKIHRLLAKHFGSFLESKTFTTNQNTTAESIIQVRMRGKSKSNKHRHDKTSEQRSKANLYTQFVLQKENMETLEAIERLSKCVGVYSSNFSYAGTKDKKAVTLQSMVVKGVNPERLHRANDEPSLANIKTGSYRIADKSLKMGQLQGNVFKIVVRNVDLKNANSPRNTDMIRECAEESIENTRIHGFVNYFGRQRFGHEEGVATRADAVGLAMLQGDMVKAVRLLLMPDSSKKDEVNKAKRYYQETGDVLGTISKMPYNMTRERLVLKALHRHGTDQDGCTKALFSIPYSMRLMYVHSYTSLIWNKMASQRLQEYTGVIAGDLVYDCNKIAFQSSASGPENPIKDNGSKLSSDNSWSDNLKSHVRIVTDKDIKTNRFTKRDLVLPLPGYNVLYPTNKIGEKYMESLASVGLTAMNFRLRSLGLSLPGSYRKLIALPKDLNYKWISKVASKNAVGLSQSELNTSSESYLDCKIAMDSAIGSLVSNSNHEANGNSKTVLVNRTEKCDSYIQKSCHQKCEQTHQTQTSGSSANCTAKHEGLITSAILENSKAKRVSTDEKDSACNKNTEKFKEQQNECKETSVKRQKLGTARKDNLDCSNVSFCNDDDVVVVVDDDDDDNSYQKLHGLTGLPNKRPRLELEGDVEMHLELSFKLNSSCYATICLREMMKS